MPEMILHGARSHFSLGQSLLSPKSIAHQAKLNGYTAATLVDVMTISGMPEFTKACKSEGIKPIIGVAVRVVEDPTYKEPRGKKAKAEGAKPNPFFFINLFHKSEYGLKKIYKLLANANGPDYFHYVSRVGWKDILEAVRGGDVIASVCTEDGLVYKIKDEEKRLDMIKELVTSAGLKNVWMEFATVDSPLYEKVNNEAEKIATKFELPSLAYRPIRYDNAENADSLDVLSAIVSNQKMSNPWFSKLFMRDFEPRPVKSFIEGIKAASESVNNRYGHPISFSGYGRMQYLFASMIEYEWSPLEPSLPDMRSRYPEYVGMNEFQILSELCKKGWREKLTGSHVFGHKPSEEELETLYKPRLMYELKILRDMQFDRYFLLVDHIIKKSNGMGVRTGPGRGSAAGSLVAYLLDITNADPIRFGLIFERFINPSRKDLPDMDLDFMSTRREDVISMIRSDFGDENVSSISNYSMLGTSSSIRDTGRVCGLSDAQMKATSYVPKIHGTSFTHEEAAEAVPEIAKFKEDNPEIWHHSKTILGAMRSLGTHAAGVVIAGEPIINRGFVESRKGAKVVNWDKRVVEDQGLIKMDVLGLATLDIIEIALQMIEERHKKRVNIDAINLHDKDVLSGLAEGDTLGIFQFESGGMRRLLKSLAQGGAFRFEDAVAATALYRPGPMDSGMLDSYVNRKQGAEIISYDHPDLEEALADTYGVMVYQEQVMRASQILAGYSMAEADNLRKVMGKKLKEAMSAEREKFIEGCKATVEWEEERAGSVFDKIAAFAGYGFNKSHALAYTLISYQAMWLKNYYPEEFYAATLSIVKEDKLQGIVKDAAKRNIIVSPPDINMSKDTFAIGYDDERKRSVLYAPFNRLKGASDKTANAILEAREKVGGRFDSKEQFLDAVNKRSCNVRVQETLEKVGAFASLDAEATPALHPDRLKDQKLLMPGLSVEDLKVSRKMRMNMEETKEFKRMLAELEVKEATEDERRRAIADRKAAELEDEEFKPTRVHPLPFIGKEPKIMVVTDYPSFSESEKGQMTQGKGFDYVKSAMREHGLSRQDGYFTALSKRPKPKGEKVTSEVVKQYSDYLKKEVELLKPSVIVALGGLSIRYFMPDVKGSFEDLCGQAHYMPDIDATVYFGINPMMVYMQPDRQSMLDDVFARVAQAMS